MLRDLVVVHGGFPEQVNSDVAPPIVSDLQPETDLDDSAFLSRLEETIICCNLWC